MPSLVPRPEHRQGRLFERAANLVTSLVPSEHWQEYQRLELRNDLIAAHVFGAGHIPGVQFFGGSRRLAMQQAATCSADLADVTQQYGWRISAPRGPLLCGERAWVTAIA